MKMKKLIKVVALAVCMTMAAPVVTPSVGIETVEAAETQKSLEKKAKKCLSDANKDCETIMDSIYGSWYFQVYKADNYFNSNILTPYSEATGIPKSKVKSIIKEICGADADGYTMAAAIQTLSYNITIVTTYYEQKGTYKKISNNLKNAKKYIKKMSNSASKKKLYQDYYNAVNKYYKYIDDPSGSFSELDNKIDSFEEKISDCQEELSW